MKLEFYSEEKLKKEIKEIIWKHLNPGEYKVFFFGSRVKGDNFSRSDIDIGIKGPKEISAGVKSAIDKDIEDLPTLYKFDVIDFKGVSRKFEKEALKHIEYVK